MRRLLLTTLLVVLAVTAVRGQSDGRDPLAEHFVAPELIMRHQTALGITEEQREQIKQEVASAQVEFTKLQWDLQAEVQKLSTVLLDDAADEAMALAQLDKVLDFEARIKRTQLSMLMGLRSVLSEEQMSKAKMLQRYDPKVQRAAERTRRQFEQMERQYKRAIQQQERALERQEKAFQKQQEALRKRTAQPEDVP